MSNANLVQESDYFDSLREQFRPLNCSKNKVGAFLLSHKNAKYMQNPDFNFTNNLLERIFAPRRRKIIPQMKLRESRRNYYEKAKSEKVETLQQSSPNKLHQSPRSRQATQNQQIAEPKENTNISPEESRIRERTNTSTIGNRKFSRDFLNHMIAIESNEIRKSSFRNEKKPAKEDEAAIEVEEDTDSPKEIGVFSKPSRERSRTTLKGANSELINLEKNSSTASIRTRGTTSFIKAPT